MRCRLVVVGLALVLVACVSAADLDPEPGPDVRTPTAAPPVSPPALAGPEQVSDTCPEALEGEGTCGLLIVPENRADAAGPVVEIAWARLPAVESDADATAGSPTGSSAGSVGATNALLVLPDGPGLGGLAEAAGWLASPLRENREIVLLDPRGTGESFPSLDCGQSPRPGTLPLDLVEDCRSTLEAQGIDLAAYQVAATAADVVDLVTTLSLPPIDVLGVGHGSAVALQVLRTDPDLLGALVLDSPIPGHVDSLADRPVTAQATLNRLLDACALDEACPGGDGLAAAFDQLVESLQRTTAEAPPPPDEVAGEDLVLAALAALRGGEGPAVVPAALVAAVEGDPEGAMARLQDVAERGAAVPDSDFSEGVRLSAACRDKVPHTAADPAVTEGLGPVGRVVAADIADLLAACAIWGLDPSAPVVADPVDGSVPTLLLVGEFDPLSPPAWAAGIAARLDAATVVQVAGAGHRAHDADDCTTGIVLDFLHAPTAPVDGTCAADRPVRFTTG